MKESSFGEQLRSHRVERARSQLDVGTEAGISQTYLGRLEAGRSVPPPRGTCERLANALGLEANSKRELLRVAAIERGSTDTEELLRPDVQMLLSEIRRHAHAMPSAFVRSLRIAVREVED